MLPDYEGILRSDPGIFLFIVIFQIIWAIGCFLLGIFGIYYRKKAEMKSKKNYYFGLGLIFILLGISRIIFFYHDFIAPEYLGAINLDILLWKIASTIMLAGFTILSYVIETYIYKKTKHIFTIFGIIITILYLILMDKSLATTILYVGNGALIFLPFLLYLFMAINTTGDIRKKAATIVLGMAILLVGSALGIFVLIFPDFKIPSLMFSPPIMLVGFIIVWYGFIKMSR